MIFPKNKPLWKKFGFLFCTLCLLHNRYCYLELLQSPFCILFSGSLNLSKDKKKTSGGFIAMERFFKPPAVLGLDPMPQIFSPFFSLWGSSAGTRLVQSP